MTHVPQTARRPTRPPSQGAWAGETADRARELASELQDSVPKLEAQVRQFYEEIAVAGDKLDANGAGYL